ncbi:MAG: serine/threonine protein kinase [Phycisphaeraceae bacterium]|nr:MAG: serine/threonine protein kinase [Phycisphaeraceae bacterium]
MSQPESKLELEKSATPSADDTAGFVPPPLDGPDISSAALDEAWKAEAEKSGTNLDTIVGRAVIEQGLATTEQVQHCLALAKGIEDPNNRSLWKLLVHNGYATTSQMARLRERLDEERKGIPGYTDFRELGRGAMAKVYRAKQRSLDRYVAVKVLPSKFSGNVQFIERFFREGQAAAKLNHPNIVQAFDVGQNRDTYYFVMEYVDGRTVHDDIIAQKRYEEKDAIEVAIQVAEALEHAHERGLIHRDVKPKNIMITKQGVVKLADMGLARAVSDKEAAEAEKGKAFGTPYYISPEQVMGLETVGPQSDIYSLGATLFHMVTGVVPFEGKDPSEVMKKHLKATLTAPDHVNPKLSGAISEVIEMMMAKKPGDRYRSCKDLLIDLRAIRAGETPPIAHRELGAMESLSGLAQAESAAAGEIPVQVFPESHRSWTDVFAEPLFLGVLFLFLLSVGLNIILAALR